MSEFKIKYIILILVLFVCLAEGNEVEARGKGGKFALLIHFFYVAATKLFVLKLIYGALFYVIATKAWHFALWFIHYLKEKKHEHHEYIEDHEPYHGHYETYDHDSYGPYGYDKHGYKKRVYETKPGHESGPYGASGPYDSSGHGLKRPYGSSAYGFSSSGQVYDADGSYSVKSG
ncbi:uncharacterized protein LOC115448969 isoform X1 [Manduca sexta]|uniref:uncharacterized protein LOC115448969 isoform X1 n=1 Tax=Manduca sexta TaxID=7130 RepID=UPI00188F7B7F|nr:uncharacterized protein LOC115448969 isoform X1 [Manduca sexta]